MNSKTYTYLLANPEHITNAHLNELSRVIEEYPYFQSAKAIRLKALKNSNSFLYNDALKVTAAYTTNRDILFQYITSEEFIQNKISEYIIQHDDALYDIEVNIEDVSQLTAIELEDELKTEIKKAEAILNPALFEKKVHAAIEIVDSEEVEIESKVQEENKSPETPLETDAPLPFKKSDTHSFSEWLQLTKLKPIDRESEVIKKEAEAAPPIEKKLERIDKFIESRPKLKVTENPGSDENLATPFIQTPNALMTETLAKVYLQQKNYEKAIKAYEILILKNPEKSGFFADQIRAIKKLSTKE